MVKLAYTPDSGSGAARCVGSNPTGCTNIWPLRLSARTSGSHPGKRSSTLLGAANRFETKVHLRTAAGEEGFTEFSQILFEDDAVFVHRLSFVFGQFVFP